RMTSGQLRPIKSDMGFIARADGSCSVSAGKSVAWASVNGPGDSHPTRRHGDKLYVESSYRTAHGDAEDTPFNSLLRTALKHTVHEKFFPRAAIQVTVHEMQLDGSMCALALTAAGIACLDAALPMRAPFCGVQVVRVAGELVADPDARMEEKADAQFDFAISTERQKGDEAPTPSVIGTSSRGEFTLQEYLQAKELACQAAIQIFQFHRECLQRKYTVESIA
ncbi:crn-5, partial [Pristionchus pacificus]